MKELNFISPFKKLCITVGNLPTAYIESMSYYEGLTFLVNYLANNVIPAVNNNSEVVKELQDQFVILKDYVDNYFKNLDVQEEINNKLDEMADSGQLSDIIAQYLGLAGMITFNTVADLKAAENLVNGSKCQTLGYHSVNDGGGAIYKIRPVTNDDIVDEMFIIEVHDDTLVAELIYNEVNIKQLGAYGDNTHNDHDVIQAAINKANYIIIPNGQYLCNSSLSARDNIVIKGEMQHKYNVDPDSYIKFDSDGFTGDLMEIKISNINFIGNNKNGSCFNNMKLNLDNCSISNFNYGLENIKISNINNCDIYNNERGISGSVDSEITNCYIYQNTEGIYLVNGSNDNIISNNKIEWNNNNGIRSVSTYHNVINNNIIDRNTLSGINLYLSYDTTVTGNMFRRNCIDLTPNVNSAQIYVSSCERILVTSNITATGTLNDGSGDTIPQRALQYQSSNNLSFIGNDFSGGTAANPVVTYSNQDDTIIYLNNGKSFTNNVIDNQIKSVDTQYINTGVTKTKTYTTPEIESYKSIYKKFRIKYNNTNNSLCKTVEFYVTILRKTGTYVIGFSDNNLNGLSFSGSQSDTTFTFTITNSGTDNMYYELEELNY